MVRYVLVNYHWHMFSERKIAQMAAWFLHRRGGRMSHLKLMKLMYLADREALCRHGAPISGDQPVAMPHGPVLTRTLDFMNGCAESEQGGWEYWISDKENHEVSLRRTDIREEELDELSPAELEVMEEIWGRFGWMNRWEIRDYTHDNLPEWEDPEGSSRPITWQQILEAQGVSEEESEALTQRLEDQRRLDRVLGCS